MSAPNEPPKRSAEGQSGADLPKRNPGASPLAAAGARAGETAAPANGAESTTTGAGSTATSGAAYTIKRLGARPARSNPRAVVIAAAVALLASGGAALAFLSQPTGHANRAEPLLTPVRSRALPAPPAPVRRPAPGPPARPGHGPAAASTKVVGVGCPSHHGDTVTFDNAPMGPGWMLAGGGWTGDGCDGSTLWTMEPNGTQPVPSTLTWRFSAAGAARCTLAVFIPTLNALGVSDYSVSVGPPGASQVVVAVPVRQSAAAGRWFTLGTFPLSGPTLEITTAPIPGGSEPGHHGAIAASAARAVCTGSNPHRRRLTPVSRR